MFPRTPDSRRPFLSDLAAHGDRRAVVSADGALSHRQLATAANRFAAELGEGRRLVLLHGRNDLASLVAYLATLASGHVAMLASSPAHLRVLAARFRPDTVVEHGRVVVRKPAPQHALHPDLALLLSTSGSTGSPKLVRLSHENLRSNAEAIASYLRLADDDLAATTLPPHYCYGLSVLHSHLHRGAAVLLTDRSVIEDCFWQELNTAGATSFAGVPYTFELLERAGFADRHLPTLRHVTQAGGRLAPARVAEFAALARLRGFEFFVMYGATEATARMAWLPPELATEHPDAIGVPVPGGRFEIRPVPGHPEGTGELVYHGPNVMLGYAEEPADLRHGRTVSELPTGDLGFRGDDGLLRVVGRRSRFAKLFGLRIDLDACERDLAEVGITAKCAGAEERLVVAALADPAGVDLAKPARRLASTSWGLPPSAVHVVSVAEFPRLANGKIDYRLIETLAEAEPSTAGSVAGGSGSARAAAIAGLLRDTLEVEVEPQDSFASLGGDSLSYVEVSLRLEAMLGVLPVDWHRLTVAELAATPADPAALGPRRPRRWRTVDATVPLRAVAITAIVATHGNLLTLLGGAHLLLAVSGFNFARFAPTGPPRSVLRTRLRSVARVAVPAMLWIGTVTLLWDTYPWRSVFLVNGLVGPPGWSEPAWHFWFIEALVATLLAMSVLTALPWWRAADRRWPFGLPFGLACAALATRYEVWEPRGGDDIHRAHVIFWLFALGWAAARASRIRHRVLLSVLVVATLAGFFHDPQREAFVALGLLLLVWVRQVRLPAPVAAGAATLASASLYIYLTHWQVYPWLEDRAPVLAVASSLAVGVLVSQIVDRIPVGLVRRRRPWPSRARGRGREAAPL